MELRSNEEATTFLLASRSKAWLEIDRTDLWMRTRRLKLEGSDLVFRGHHQGQLIAAPTIDLANVWNVEYGESLSDWERLGLLAAARVPEGTKLSLPVGWYEVVTGGGDVIQRFVITRDRVVTVR